MSLPTILERIAGEREADVRAQAARYPLDAVREAALLVEVTPGGFYDALAAGPTGVISEVKRASPSKGRIADIPAPVTLAASYARGGASAISVLTEPRHFLGSEADLRAVAQSVTTPVIRKDFLVDPYQVWEARAWGASACLLIVAILNTPARLGAMLAVTTLAGIDALVEVHDEEELALAQEAGAKIVGVNNRNLHTFDVDLGTFERLRPLVSPGVLAIAESGIHNKADFDRMARAGADAVLIGEYLARSADPAQTIRELLLER